MTIKVPQAVANVFNLEIHITESHPGYNKHLLLNQQRTYPASIKFLPRLPKTKFLKTFDEFLRNPMRQIFMCSRLFSGTCINFMLPFLKTVYNNMYR